MDIHDVLNRLQGVKGAGGQWSARCPAHDDKHQSLSVSVGDGGRILLNCHAGCDAQSIVTAMGLTMKDLFSTEDKGTSRATFEAEYIYRDSVSKQPILKKVKMREPDGGKFCYWMQPGKDGNWIKGRGGVDPPLYTGDHELGAGVLLVEGEKDVDTVQSLGLSAASLPDGASSKWRDQYGKALEGRAVFIIQDNDAPGKAFAQRIAGNLHDIASNIKVLDLTRIWPGLPEKGDTTDLFHHLGADGTKAAIKQLIKETPDWELTGDAKKPTLDTITAADLQQKDLPPIKFIVDKLLSVGLNILASPPKYGKSWMVLALCLAVASGGRFLGYMTNQCGCLYLALEDSQRRLKTRMNKLLAGKPAPAGFHFATAASPIDGGLFDELEDFLKKHPDTGLIVVDTLQRVRGASHGKEGAYSADYREIGALKAFADQHNVALLLVHHLRKMKDDGDPFNMISGTNGIMGAADTTMVLTKEKRGDSNATFSVVGRDVESSDTVLRFNKDTCYWENLGDADWFAEQQARQEYQESPIVQTIKKLLEQSPEGWSGTAQQLMDAGRFIVRRPLADSTQGLSKKLQNLDRLLFENDGIVHERKRNGSGGGKHKFYSNAVPQFEELEQTEFDPFLRG